MWCYGTDMHICWQLLNKQDFFMRNITDGYQRGVGDHRVRQ